MKTYTPLRYPGGKTKLYNHVVDIIESNYTFKPVYAEAFAGGFGLGLKLLLNNKVKSVILNDYDVCIYSFWRCVTNEELFKKFIIKLKSTDINIEIWKQQKAIYKDFKNNSILDVGFATFFLNRCNRSGILKANPIGGLRQLGNYQLDCRFNKTALITLLNKIHELRKCICVCNLEAIDFINSVDCKIESFFYFDPPYVTAGPLLYKNSYNEIDHIHLSKTISMMKNYWLLTYDDHHIIRENYSECYFKTYEINYSLHEKRRANELIIYDSRLSIDNEIIV